MSGWAVHETALSGVLRIDAPVFGDARGAFRETWHAPRYAAAGVPPMVQVNASHSAPGVVRGLHAQHPGGQGKLVSVLDGAVYDVAVDVRRGSPTFGRHVGVELSAGNGRQLYIPPGFAHGFCVTSPGGAVVLYGCTSLYAPGHELTVRWDDPALGIDWPLRGVPVLSPRDAAAPPLAALDAALLPPFDLAHGPRTGDSGP